MKTPKKTATKATGKKASDETKSNMKAAPAKPARKFDDDDDDDFNEPIDDLGGFDELGSFDDDDDF